MTNFEIYMETINRLKGSQGFYSRMARAIGELSESALEVLKDEINGLPKWNGSLDCILYLEQ